VRLTSPAAEATALALPLRLVLIELLLRPMGPWAVRVSILAVAMGGLLSSRVLLAPLTWLALAALVAARLLVEWPLPDNHIYLLAYFCAGAAIALGLPEAREALGRTSRLLLGLAFAFAVLWKAGLSPDYLDGRFFRVTLLADDRFEGAALRLGGLDEAQLRANRAALVPLPGGAEAVDPPEVTEPPALRRLAALATWGTLLLEAVLAVLFLWPAGERLDPARHAVLLGFCAVTYAFAPVAGFGWLLLVMGVARCRPGQGWRAAYVVLFFLILVYSGG
jgi:hypothetical protein